MNFPAVVLTILLLVLHGAGPAYTAPMPDDDGLRLGVLRPPQHVNPVGLYSAAQSTALNQVVSEGWLLPLAGPLGPRGDFLPISATTVTTQAHMKRERLPTSFLRYVTVVLPLRRDLSWSDGSPLQATDVVFTYETWQQLDVASLGGNWPALFPPGLLHAVEAVDPYTVKFWLTRLPGLGEWQHGLLAAPLLKKTAWEADVFTALQQDNPAASLAKQAMRPVVLGSRLPGRTDEGMVESLPHRDDIRHDEKVALFQSGGAALSNARSHFEFRTPSARGMVSQVIEDPDPLRPLTFSYFDSRRAAQHALKQGDIDELLDPLHVWPGESVGLRVLAFNLERPQSAAPALRQALRDLIDRDALIQLIREQIPTLPVLGPTHTLVPPIHAPWHHPFVGQPGPPPSAPLRLIRAQSVLGEAGYRPAQPLTLVTPTVEDDPVSYAIARAMADLLARLNIPSQITALSAEHFYPQVFEQQDYDLAVVGWRLGGNTFPHQLALLFDPPSGAWNMTGYDSLAYRHAAQQLWRAPDTATAQQAALILQDILYEDVPLIPLITIGPSPTPGRSAVWSSLAPRINTVWLD